MSLIKSTNVGSSDAPFYNNIVGTSLRFNDNDDANLNIDFGSAGNRKLWTFSTWFKRANLADGTLFAAYASASVRDCIRVLSNVINFQLADGSEGYNANSTALLRDTSAWYHLVVQFNSADSTETNRTKMWINGLPITLAESGDGIAAQNVSSSFGNDKYHTIGARRSSGTDNNLEFDGYMADTHYVNGAALDYTSFAEFKNGVLIPKAYSGSYGTNGFYFKYDQVGVGTASTSTIGADISGNTNHFTSSNLVASDCAIPDCPENNFCTGIPGNNSAQGDNNAATYSQGNLSFDTAGNSTHGFGSMSIKPFLTDGCYWEVRIDGKDSGARNYLGIAVPNIFADTASYGYTHKALLKEDGVMYATLATNATVTTNPSTKNPFVNNDVVGVAVKGTSVWYHVNGVYVRNASNAVGNPSTGANPPLTGAQVPEIATAHYLPHAGYHASYSWNFGQDPTFAGLEDAPEDDNGDVVVYQDANGIGSFQYPVPTGFLSMCTFNMEETTIGPNSDTQATDYFNTILYAGDDGTQTITDVEFKPDWVWIKNRNGTYNHNIFDSSRGALKVLNSNLSAAENAGGEGDLISFNPSGSITTNGFTVRQTSNYELSDSGKTYVAWNWKANGGTTSSNTDGTTTSTVQANTDAGFSIVTYAGNSASKTVGHGLSSAPEWVIVKSRTDAERWAVFHTSISNQYIYLNETFAGETSNADERFGNSSSVVVPNSTVVTLGANNSDVNENGDNYVMYCFHSVEGYSKMGIYTGNSVNGDGPFVFLGFKPAWIMIKSASATSAFTSWAIYDNVRKTFNDDVGANSKPLFANKVAAEGTRGNNSSTTTGNATALDFLSNGFKCRVHSDEINQSNTYIYMAFAEQPFKYANAE